ncbi:CubicO group peptidase (beta-lactamase class C family) [Actinomadura namibiensis]|uniref:CubicO group peptidase (Beta-lactamase class C family) n=1 Tax=Actinomadura namibiensis TaxID=182080 RepID=A0A7W3LVC8_ACTNM|nr:serine hydrolase domain-containing protein [Actinomadura namibiensis]MBA8955024.1 CubicO group peptidase (beta-lactamase class C family) [Actinomadura namibiensis]
MRTRLSAAIIAIGLAVAMTPAPPAHAVTGSPAEAQVRPETIDAYAHRVRKASGMPGMSLVVTHGRRVVHAAGYGHDSTGRPVTARTPMRVASLSKSFTAAAVMTLVDEGRIALDRPVAAQMPEFRTADPRAARITVRQLLNQTSGLSDRTVDIGATQDAGSLREYVARLRTARLTTDPGTRWAYCNVNYNLAARLVEVAGGRPFGDYLRRRVFAPLGMNGSAVSDRDVRPADGHHSLFGLWIARSEAPGFLDGSGSGGVITNAHDMGRWLIAQSGQAPRTLNRAALRTMHAPGPATGDHRYGMGWAGEEGGTGPARLVHSGNIFTYNAAQAIVPSTGYGVAVMVNGAGLTDVSWSTLEGLLTLIDGRTPPAPGRGGHLTELALGLIVLVSVGLGVLAGFRARRWARRRAAAPRWRIAPRLVPALLPVAVFAAYPQLVSLIIGGRAVTWAQLTYFAAPLTIALAAAALAGLVAVALRLWALARFFRRTGGGDAGDRPLQVQAASPQR